jgi:hypothetical protein
VVLVLGGAPLVFANVFSYECDSFPDQAGWDIIQIWCDPTQWVEDGWFFQHMELCEGYPPPGGQQGAYRRSLAEYIGTEEWFVEWVVQTDAERSELPWGGGANLSAWSQGGVNYAFFIAGDQVELNRDNTLPIIFVDLEPGVPHTYRLELYGAQLYIWYIDSAIVDSGVPEGAFPSFYPHMNFRAKAAWLPNTTKWDYIRYGVIPQPGSGDFDSDGIVGLEDLYFFHDCLLGSDADGPGCSWADMDADGITDGQDIGLFVDALLAPPQPTRPGPGVRSVNFDGRATD